MNTIEQELDLSGEWIGHYPGHYDECIRIVQDGDDVEALKITGDDYVPAGAITWRANLRTGHGVGLEHLRRERVDRHQITGIDLGWFAAIAFRLEVVEFVTDWGARGQVEKAEADIWSDRIRSRAREYLSQGMPLEEAEERATTDICREIRRS